MSTIDVGFKTENPFVPLEVTRRDLVLSSIAFGFYFGYSIQVTWTAVHESRRVSRKFSAFIVMVWLEIAANTIYAVLSWLYITKRIPPGLPLFLVCIICWIVGVQCLMLIIVNRLCILWTKPQQQSILKYSVATIVTLISISSACIWIPAQLQINHQYMQLNEWFDRAQKSVYLILDLVLNILYIRLVKGRLVAHGLKKYENLMKFNQNIIVISIALDGLLIGVTGPQQSSRLYAVYMAKLNIMISMSQLLIKVARSTGINVSSEDKGHTSHTTYSRSRDREPPRATGAVAVHIDTHIYTHGGDGDEFETGRREVNLKQTIQEESEHSQSSADVKNTVQDVQEESGSEYSITPHPLWSAKRFLSLG
ncbi:hypothetical protein BDZ89DRAFT_1038378 [Hymenopellis radicata]|nr:hypothetical protein BDZ89DRAFT_1038378 [Hymenopellis radicata]